MKKKILIIGNFNVIHVGHLRLFSYAKKIADHLIVGVISDKNSNSDLLINESKRLEGLKSNKFINESFIIKTSLKNFIKRHKPHFYLKGKEFENQNNPEKKILDKINCKLIFGSGDEQLSSLDLIKDEINYKKNNIIINDLNYYKRNNINKLILSKYINKFKDVKALVVGENIIDKYIFTNPLGMSQESSLVVHKPVQNKIFLGGASVIAMHLSSVIKKIDYLTIIEKKDKYSKFISSTLKKNKINSFLIEEETYKTVIKTRYLSENKNIFRTNEFLNFNINKSLEEKILNKFKFLVKNKDLLIISDFNYGMLPKEIVLKMIKISKKLNKKIIIVGDSQTSSQNGDISKFKNIDLITPTEIEAKKYISDSSLGLAAISKQILRKLNLKYLITTLNKDGVLIDTKKKTDKIGSLANIIQDTAGAGDAFLAYTSLTLSTGANIWDSSFIGSVASAIHVSNIGNNKIDFKTIKNCINQIQ